MAGLNREDRKRRRLILSNFYTRLFQVSKGRKARRSRPKDSTSRLPQLYACKGTCKFESPTNIVHCLSTGITKEDPDKELLNSIKKMEQRVRELASRNEELKYAIPSITPLSCNIQGTNTTISSLIGTIT